MRHCLRLALSGLLPAAAVRLKHVDCLPQGEFAAAGKARGKAAASKFKDKNAPTTKEKAATVIQAFWRGIWIRIYSGMVKIAMGATGIFHAPVRVVWRIVNEIYKVGRESHSTAHE